MPTINQTAMRSIGEAVKKLDSFSHLNDDQLGPQENVQRIDNARKNLVNVLFSCGYELQEFTSSVIKSKHQRPLI